MPQLINMTSYREKINRNGNAYLVVKDTNNDSYMAKDVRLFSTIKNSLVISADVQIETGTQGAIFRNIITAETVTPGQLPVTPEKQWGGGKGGGREWVDDSPRIVRQNVLNRGTDIAIALYNKGELAMEANETPAHALVRNAKAFAEHLETWVHSVKKAEPAQSTTVPPVAMPSVQTPPAVQPTPVTTSVIAAPVDDDEDIPF